MSEKALKLNNIKLHKKEFCKSKEPIELMSVIVDQKDVSHKFKHNSKGFKYFIRYLEVGKHYVLFYLKWVDTSNTFKMVVKTCLFWLKIMNCRKNTIKVAIWLKQKLGIKFHSEPVYECKYLKVKVRKFDGLIKTNFLANHMPKENIYYTCITWVTIDSVLKID